MIRNENKHTSGYAAIGCVTELMLHHDKDHISENCLRGPTSAKHYHKKSDASEREVNSQNFNAGELEAIGRDTPVTNNKIL